MDPLTAALVTAGISAGANLATRKKPSVKKTSTLTKTQKNIQWKLLADYLNIPSSQLRSNKDFIKLLDSGYLDKTSFIPEKIPYPEDIVADLTATQKNVLGQVGGFIPRTMNTNISAATGGAGGMASLFTKQGLTPPTSLDVPPAATNPLGGLEVVGEDGPETITANKRSLVMPAEIAKPTSADTTANTPQPLKNENWLERAPEWWESPSAGKMAKWLRKYHEKGKIPDTDQIATLAAYGLLPDELKAKSSPVTEDNQVGAKVTDFPPQIPGMATGGVIEPGHKALVGEQGPELVMETQNAASRALSGIPSSQVNTGTTENFIQQGIAAPARQGFERGTLQQIKSSYAGPGYWGSARAKAEATGRGDVESQINALGSQYRYQDEQAKRELAESAANRSLNAIPSALAVQNNPLGQLQTKANIAATEAGTGATQFATQRGQALLSGEIGQQKANVEATQFGTQRGQALLGGEVGQQSADIKATLANAGLTDAQSNRVQTLIEQDIATTGRISAETEQVMAQTGIANANIADIKAKTALSQSELYARAASMQQQQQALITSQLNNLSSIMKLAGIEQAQNQAEINGQIAQIIQKNETAAAFYNWLNGVLGDTQQAAIAMPGQEGIDISSILTGIGNSRDRY